VIDTNNSHKQPRVCSHIYLCKLLLAQVLAASVGSHLGVQLGSYLLLQLLKLLWREGLWDLKARHSGFRFRLGMHVTFRLLQACQSFLNTAGLALIMQTFS
jgi:hypothetical protein